MAELVPARFSDLVTRLVHEPRLHDALFELPRKRWYVPAANAPDPAVRFHGQPAGNPAGPAAGPHTQMAQNLLLSYLAGGRILELKTVQVDDRLKIPRPCIDVTNVGYNVEWSQELRVEESLREYVAGAMLIHMFRHSELPEARALRGPAGGVVYDISVGYELAGIRSAKVRGFLEGMRDAGPVVRRLRDEIPEEFRTARDMPYPERLSTSVTLSTFHGCPAGEIERICEFLIAEHDFDVIVKMNPPMLGREALEHLLHDVLGYSELTVNPAAYESGLAFDEAVQLCDRLGRFAAQRGRRLGCKFSNTLEVLNHRTFFTPDNRVQYLSGQPLHVITLTLTDLFRQAVGPHVPISFSAGIDRQNFPLAAACGFVPITASTDLLRPGGYSRMAAYVTELTAEMARIGAANLDAYIMSRFDQEEEARRRVAQESGERTDAGRPDPLDERTSRRPNAEAGLISESGLDPAVVRWAGLLNTSIVAAMAREDPRYRAAANRKVPKRIDSHLRTFDCITCDKCLPVCPNAANFSYPTPPVAFDYHDLIVDPAGAVRPAAEVKRFEITSAWQIACYSDFCNECGNCDTFCPEYGGPYIRKPTFFGSLETLERAAPRDGFVVGRDQEFDFIQGRYQGRMYRLSYDRRNQHYLFEDAAVQARFKSTDYDVVRLAPRSMNLDPPAAGMPGAGQWELQPGAHTIDMGVLHTLRHLLHGMLDSLRIHQVNAGASHAAAAPGP